jgi:hypothetical protein
LVQWSNSTAPSGKVSTCLRNARLAAKPAEIALALGERQAAQIDAVLMQQIEHEDRQLRFVRLAHAHLRHQLIEVRGAARID